ncbi:MAG: type IV pili methyl-accepting chemotaxis transducer N-terminal domain-containing protein [Pseudomonadota bacterium]
MFTYLPSRACTPKTLFAFYFVIITAAFWAQQTQAQADTSQETLELVGNPIVSDAADRIVLASEIRTLTQQVAAASCSVTSNVDVEEAHDVLEAATKAFDDYIVALRDGDETLNIVAPETNARILHDIAFLNEEWMTIHGAVDRIIAGEGGVDASHLIDDDNLKLLELATQLQSDINGRYANPYEMTAADAMMVEIAGRQLMLTQKMAKDACEIWSDYNAEAGRADLQETMEIFENSLRALLVGLPAAGLQPAPTPKIREDLEVLLERWEIIKVNQQTLVDGGQLNEDQKYEIFHDLQLELTDLRVLLEDYRAYAERNHAQP